MKYAEDWFNKIIKSVSPNCAAHIALLLLAGVNKQCRLIDGISAEEFIEINKRQYLDLYKEEIEKIFPSMAISSGPYRE